MLVEAVEHLPVHVRVELAREVGTRDEDAVQVEAREGVGVGRPRA